MKKSLSHLPDYKQTELRELTDIIVKAAKPEMIILFGSYARGNWVEDRFTDPEDHHTYEYKSDYDICVLTRTKGMARNAGLWMKCERLIRCAGIKTWPNIIAHDIKEFNKKIEKREYFFCDIKKEGVVLFDTKNFKIAASKRLSVKERRKIAKEDFEQWFEGACNFFKGCNFFVSEKKLKEAAFLLHQATERFYAALLLVFTQYKPRTHDIEILGHQVSTFDPRLCAVFPQFTEEDKRLFNLIKKAYIDARYKRSYSITKDELAYLSDRVEKLRALTEEICKKKIVGSKKRTKKQFRKTTSQVMSHTDIIV
jgi:uncharacterized protein